MVSTYKAGAPSTVTTEIPDHTVSMDLDGLDPDAAIPWVPAAREQWAVRLSAGQLWSTTAAIRILHRGGVRHADDPPTLFATVTAAAKERATVVSMLREAFGTVPADGGPTLVVRNIITDHHGIEHTGEWRPAEDGGLDSVAEAVGL